MLNKTGIETYDATWNPVTGCELCCPYCYAKKKAENPFYSRGFPYGFEPHFYPERLNEPKRAKLGRSIFVCSMADLFGEWVSKGWIYDIFAACIEAPQHQYCFLTKNPARYLKIPDHFVNNDNMWFGATLDCRKKILMQHDLAMLKQAKMEKKFISFEPLLGNPGRLDLEGIDQIIIGAQTDPFIEPPAGAVDDVIYSARRAGCDIFIKNSLLGVNYVPILRELRWQVRK